MSKSFSFAPDRLTISFSFPSPIAVIDIIRPLIQDVISPPIISTLYFSQANKIPSCSSSIASKVYLLEIQD